VQFYYKTNVSADVISIMRRLIFKGNKRETRAFKWQGTISPLVCIIVCCYNGNIKLWGCVAIILLR